MTFDTTTPTTNIGPGLGAFLSFFVLAVALWLLMRNMNTRMRRIAYRERAEQEAADGHTADGHAGTGQAATGQAADGQAADGHAADQDGARTAEKPQDPGVA